MTNILEKYKFVLTEKPERADYSSAVLLNLKGSEREKKAEKILEELKKSEFIKSVSVDNGFVNVRVNDKFLIQRVEEILVANKNFGRNALGKNKKALLEFISANPTGPLTLGNGRGGFGGDVLARILQFCGYRVTREFYVNDVGNQIEILAKSLQTKNSRLRQGFGGQAKLKIKNGEGLYRGDYIDELATRLAKSEPRQENIGQWAVNEILENYLKPTIGKMGINLDHWISEKELAREKIKAMINLLKKKNLTYEKDGALWLKAKQLGSDKDEVLIRQNGEHTYFAADIAYHRDKIERGYDLLINFWGADHAGHVKRLEAVIEKVLAPELKWQGKIVFIVFQLVHLFKNGKEVRMSKRSGTYVTMDELLDEVGLDAARWFFLNKGFNTHVNFDLALAKKQSKENPVYYGQYAFARIHGVLAKQLVNPRGQPQGLTPGVEEAGVEEGVKEEERKLILQLADFPRIIAEIGRTFELQKLTTYIYEMSEVFHKFYDNCPILRADKKAKEWRLALLAASLIVLKNCFLLLGIEAKKRM